MATGRNQFVIKANDDGCSADVIATTPYVDRQTWHEANARLIAAAPGLLAALEDVNDALTWFYEAEPQLAGQHFGAALQERMEHAIAHVGPTQHDRTVVVEVSGGVAEITRCPDGIDARIIDHDNP